MTTPSALRVLLITPDFPPAFGGIQRLLHRITSAMPGSEVQVLTPDAPGARAFDIDSGVTVRRVPVGSSKPIVRNALFNARGVAALGSWKPDVILNGHVVTSPLATLAARRFRVPTVLYVYGKEIAGRPRLAAWGLRRSAAAVAVSEYTKSQLVAAANGREVPPVHVVHPGVDVPQKSERASGDGPFTMLTVGRLRDWYKGHDVVLEAMPRVLERIPDARWIVLGDGRRRAALESRAAELGVAHAVQFRGAVDDAEKERWLADADAFVMPARYPRGEVAGEGFPVVYLEAAAWGLPAIAGNVGGPREAVLHRETGLLVDPESVAEIATALLDLGTNPAFARELGSRARERASSAFTWQSVAGELESLLRQVAGNANA